jgi:hypothetical protein
VPKLARRTALLAAAAGGLKRYEHKPATVDRGRKS